MTPEEALEAVEQAIEPKQLNKIQQLVFKSAWQGLSYSEITKATGYDEGYIKDTGSKLWQMLSKTLDKKVTKQNLQAVLKHYARHDKESHATKNLNPSQDWGEAIDASIFYGRSHELTTLDRWIAQDKCRLVTILGLGGVGKTILSIRLAEQVQTQFDYLIWRSLRDTPPLNALLTTLLRFLSKDDSSLPEMENGKLTQLQERLQTVRCLIVLDNFDALFTPGQPVGVYREGYEGYGELLQRMSAVRHQSCCIITSRDTLPAISVLQGESLPVRELRLQGLEQVAAQNLLLAKGLNGSQAELNHLIQCYQGNPLALKITATSIHSLFAGNIADFIGQGVAVFNGIRSLLTSQIERLSELEQQVMYWIAINRESVSVSELHSDIFPSVPTSVLLETLESLKGRSLIERTAEGFTQQPVVMEYMTERLIVQVGSELTGATQNFLNRYALMKATARDYIRASQIRVIVEPIVNQAIAHLGSKQKFIAQLHEILARWHSENLSTSGYAVGNFLNLFNYLQIDLTGYDFSHFSVWQAYLADVKLQQVNFADADLSRSVFAETFGGVSCVAFSRDGQLLATSDTSGEVQIWDLASGRQLNAFKSDLVWTWTVAFSPDGQLLASGGDDYVVKLWDAKTGGCLQLLDGHTHTVNCVAFHPNGHLLASCSQDIRIWQVDREALFKVLQGHQGRVWSVAFSPDGSTLVSGSEDRTLKLWDVGTGECRQTLDGHAHWVKSVAFSRDGQIIASGSFDGVIKLWSVSTGECLGTWQGHQSTVTMVAFSPSDVTGKMPVLLASASYDETVKVWDIVSQQCIQTLREHSNRVWSVAFSPSDVTGRRPVLLASGGDDHATRLWHLKTGQCVKAWKGHTNSILSIALSQKEQLLAAGHEDQTVKLWNLHTGQISTILRGHENRVWSVAFAPQTDETIVASGSADRTIKFWNVRTGHCLKTLYGHGSWVWSVAFSPDGHQLASSSYDRTVKLWDVESGECLKTFAGHTAPVIEVIFSRDGRWIASCSFDAMIKLWEVGTGKCLQTLEGHQNTVWAIAFSPDGNYLASGSYDQTVKLWDILTGACLQTFAGHSAPLMSLAFPTNGQQLASGSFDRTVKVWDIQTGNCLYTLNGHTGLVSTLVFQSLNSGEILISGSFDETIRFWNSQTGECLQTLRTPRPYDGMKITGVTGLTEAQKATLKALGADEKF